MPGSQVRGNELHEGSIPTDEKMRGHTQSSQSGKIGVPRAIKCIGEQLLHFIATIMTGGQTDAVDNEKADIARY